MKDLGDLLEDILKPPDRKGLMHECYYFMGQEPNDTNLWING